MNSRNQKLIAKIMYTLIKIFTSLLTMISTTLHFFKKKDDNS